MVSRKSIGLLLVMIEEALQPAAAAAEGYPLPSGSIPSTGSGKAPRPRNTSRLTDRKTDYAKDRRSRPAIVRTGSSVDQRDPIGFEALLAIDDVDPHPLAGAEGIDPAA